MPLPADIGSDAFNSAYLAALAGQSETKGHARSVHAARQYCLADQILHDQRGLS